MNKYIKFWKTGATAFLLITFLHSTQAADWYVALDGAGGGTSWADATNSIQGAIIKSAVGDTVWVSNGVYEVGGITNYPSGSLLTNRIAISKAITVRSKDNDPVNTVIKGAWASNGNTNGVDAVRGVYMVANSKLIGFTITNGATLVNTSPAWMTTHFDVCGGGILCPNITTPVISNCVITGNSAYGGGGIYYGGGGAWYGTFYNCSFIGNLTLGAPSAGGTSGGGARGSILFNCALTGNLGKYGGACGYGTVMSNCVLTANIGQAGGGAAWGTMYNCSVISNKSNLIYGGGVYYSTLYSCTLTGNTAPNNMAGGGAYDSILYNCLLTGNYAGYGGGAGLSSASKLYNCTVVGNKSGVYGGGGVYGGVLSSCVVFFNTSLEVNSNWFGSPFVNSCTAPAASGAGNIAANPMLIDKGSNYGTNHVAGNYRLEADSPCIDTGTNMSWMTNGTITSKDMDGKLRIQYGIVDMGAYETVLGGIVTAIQ